jgi:aerobic carbon-monoxide dehydrogenase medium subunit
MKPAPFKYLAPESVAAAVAMKAQETDDARFLAGGQSLIPAMNFRLAQPNVLIDINPVAELDYVRMRADGAVAVGALARLSTLQRSSVIRSDQPLVFETIPNVAHAQIRNRATLCGNLANADPASELPAVVVALNARLQARSVRGDRWIEARDFFKDVFTTSIEGDELLSEVEFPALPSGTGTCFLELARRRGDYAMMGVAAVLRLHDDGTCLHARLVYCNAGATPILATQASEALIGTLPDEPRFELAANLAQSEIDPPGTVHATKAFQKHLAGVLTKRALQTALRRAQTAGVSAQLDSAR